MVRRTHFVRGTNDNGKAVAAMLTDIKKYFDGVTREMMDAAEQAGHVVLDHATELAPLDTGALRESGKVFIDKRKTKNPKVEIAFGGETPVTDKHSPDGFVDYAVEVHENIEGQFKVGGPKFLEHGAAEALPQVVEILEKAARRAARKQGRKQ